MSAQHWNRSANRLRQRSSPENARIELSLVRKPRDIMVTLDGQEGYEIDEKDSLIIEKAPHPVKMIILPGQRYFDVLKAKLQWGGGGDSEGGGRR